MVVAKYLQALFDVSVKLLILSAARSIWACELDKGRQHFPKPENVDAYRRNRVRVREIAYCPSDHVWVSVLTPDELLMKQRFLVKDLGKGRREYLVHRPVTPRNPLCNR